MNFFRFGKACESRIVTWLKLNVNHDKMILEVGCGNGHLLHRLQQQGFSSLYGMDYSEQAVRMASTSSTKHSPRNGDESSVQYFQEDILNLGHQQYRYDVIIDKGTLDAICLGIPRDDAEISRTMQIKNLTIKYATAIATLLASRDAFLLITSCNWTADELQELFYPFLVPAEPELYIPFAHPSFSFGGQQGHTVTSLIFRIPSTRAL